MIINLLIDQIAQQLQTTFRRLPFHIYWGILRLFSWLHHRGQLFSVGDLLANGLLNHRLRVRSRPTSQWVAYMGICIDELNRSSSQQVLVICEKERMRNDFERDLFARFLRAVLAVITTGRGFLWPVANAGEVLG